MGCEGDNWASSKVWGGEAWGDALIGERQRRKELMATESQQLGMQWTKGEPRSLGAGSTL